jgi:glycosyltransferase involved in cell wall biosynthesis
VKPLEIANRLTVTRTHRFDGASASVRSIAIIGSRGYPSFYGGFETLVRKLAPYLADRGWDVTVYSRPGATSDAIEHRHPGVRSVMTKGIESKFLSTLTFGASSTFDAARRKPDVALVMNVANGYWLPLLRSRGIPSVLNVDGIEWQRPKWNWLGKSVFKGGAKMTARFADVLVCDSTEIGRFWRDNFKRGGVFIPYGGDLPERHHELPPGLERRGYVLLVARLVPENTVAEFLDAAEDIVQDYPVVVVGSSGCGGPLESRIRSLAETHDRLTWLGQVSNDPLLFSLWQNCGAYFHGHSVGGTNPALVQAMACGAPTIARDTLFNREVLQTAGVYVPPNPSGIVAAIRDLMSNPTMQDWLGAKAQARAAKEFSWESICAAYERILCDSMCRRTAPCPRKRYSGAAAGSNRPDARSAVFVPQNEHP